MHRSLTACGLVVITLLVAGCAPRPFASDGHENMKSSSLAWKQVFSKREPTYLIAADGTECTVSKERFAKIKTGESALCVWRTVP